jgi:hypothetical protein
MVTSSIQAHLRRLTGIWEELKKDDFLSMVKAKGDKFFSATENVGAKPEARVALPESPLIVPVSPPFRSCPRLWPSSKSPWPPSA